MSRGGVWEQLLEDYRVFPDDEQLVDTSMGWLKSRQIFGILMSEIGNLKQDMRNIEKNMVKDMADL